MTGLLIALALIAGHFHWGAGLVAFSVWLPWQILTQKRIGLVPGWQGWGIALAALIASTALSERPSGLAWVGLLQWLSLGCGILALQAMFREHPEWLSRSWWVLLATGVFDAMRWSLDLFHAHREWWAVRVDGLPLFPFRIRLFGSHGSTQAAAWLGTLLLVGTVWAYPRLRPTWAKVAGVGLLLWWAMLLGMCDSRLAMVGLYAVVAVTCWREGIVPSFIALSVVPAFLWIMRDQVHPSQVVTGGGSRFGLVILGAACASIASALALRRILTSGVFMGAKRSIAGWTALAIPVAPLAMLVFTRGEVDNIWSTGRHAFWGAAVRILQDHPLFGVGPWGYVWEYSLHHPWGYAFLPMHAHNAALEIATTGGFVLLAGVLWIAWGALDWGHLRWDGAKHLLLTGVFLAVSMSFDSPLSSPQLQLVVVLVGASVLTCRPEREWAAPPRSLCLAPLMLLVPLAFAVEAQVGKVALVEAGRRIRHGAWQEGANEILEATGRSTPDPQWFRNTLMARTAFNAQTPDSLRHYRPLWDSLVRIEPGFHPNRIHLAWIDMMLHPEPRANQVFQELLRQLWLIDQPEPSGGPVSDRWRAVYANDSLGHWLRELELSRIRGDMPRIRWIELWIDHRIPACGLSWRAWSRLSGRDVPLLVRPIFEQNLYGSEGTRWLLIPQIERRL